MRIAPNLRKWLVENRHASAAAPDDELRAIVGGLAADGVLTEEQYLELQSKEGDDEMTTDAEHNAAQRKDIKVLMDTWDEAEPFPHDEYRRILDRPKSEYADLTITPVLRRWVHDEYTQAGVEGMPDPNERSDDVWRKFAGAAIEKGTLTQQTYQLLTGEKP